MKRSRMPKELHQWLEDAERLGIEASDAVPPLTRFLWRLGIRAIPPLLSSPRRVWISLGIYFGISCFVVMGIPGLLLISLAVSGSEMLTAVVVFTLIFILAGVAFGRIMSRHVRDRRAALDLPEWSKYLDS